MSNQKIYDQMLTIKRRFDEFGFEYIDSEKDVEVKSLPSFPFRDYEALTSLYYYGARYLDPTGAMWLSVDPLFEKYVGMSPYGYCAGNPVRLVDTDGREPVREYVGTAQDFLYVINVVSRNKVGMYKGLKASEYLSKLGDTEFSFKQMRPLPTQTGFFNMKKGRYIYTKKGGWLDMSHFMFYAGKAYKYKLDGEKYPVGKALQDGLLQELSDVFFAKHSAFSYEDLCSDKFGAQFGANIFDPNSDLSFSEQLGKYLIEKLGATSIEDAPNYNTLPQTDSDTNGSYPSCQNFESHPMYLNKEIGENE